ncbi:MAG TPA: hypothetical protein VJ745_02050 [Gaiellaceae bacterium]|nr:hypothetical protein [Gaiellaceae bacterium]
MTPAAARLVLLGRSDDNRLAGVRRRPSVDEALRGRRWAAAAVAYGLELGMARIRAPA